MAGCSAHTPNASARVAEISSGYVRDGKEYPAGFFGGGLVDAVRDNEPARKEASTARDLSIWGFTFEATGAAAQVVGVPLAMSSHDKTTQAVAYGAVALGGVLVLTGIIFGLRANAHRLDAINIYNDGVVDRPTPSATFTRPGGSETPLPRESPNTEASTLGSSLPGHAAPEASGALRRAIGGPAITSGAGLWLTPSGFIHVDGSK